ncbi:MAG: amino acid permease [Desulfarculaceae bacterium]|nr:amino acid permease [Desulfarculaceae bacterium]MCF8049545.1 amino acid permease [Desulfarculaceae bacterium]MCF8065459.1 amino acid permease [Desulfarculaceae bacterium]MCF8099457.1 amino acid permease [Desulfarculaceae bacterium]MCF8121737.1 amino acid permease [Desulfarculaceae bacterium]
MSSLAGSGVIALPQQLAATGSITLISFLLVTIGALFLTMVYVRAGSMFDDPSPTALATYVNPVLGAKSGFFYVYGNLISNVSILIAGLGYLAMFVPALNHPIFLGITVIILIWLFVWMSLRGVGIISKIVSITVTLLLISVIITAVAGWLDFDPALFKQNWNVSGLGEGKAIMSGFAVLIFSFVGVESIATNNEQIRNPKKIVPIATIVGFIIVAVLYIASTTVIEGMFPAKQIQQAPASFAMSMNQIFNSKIVGEVVSAVMAIACIASFMVWNLSSASAAKTSADNGFLPKAYSHTNKHGIYSKGLVINGVIMTVVELILMSLGSNIAVAFNITVTISVLLLLFPYFWSGIAIVKKDRENGTRSIGNMIIVLLSSVFIISAFASATLDELWLVIALVMVVMGAYALILTKSKAAPPSA